jgi:peptidoglycan/xylan/chitin deacetylase (PgdA/CDA1 family)
MKPLLLTFDVEEFDLPAELGRPLERDQEFAVTASGLAVILALLARHGVRATFFVTGAFARERPLAVSEIAHAGHEVAVHGLAHADDYTCLAPEIAVARLASARGIIEQMLGSSPAGVRTPRLRPCPSATLRAAGFSYDASPHPTWMPGRYRGLGLPRAPWREDGLVRLPISVLPGLRLPVSWLWYRAVGRVIGLRAIRLAARAAPYLHLYFHPWEAVDIRGLGVPRWLAVRTGAKFVDGLDHLVGALRSDFEAITVADCVHRIRDGGYMPLS